jgi:hypothetical protein
MRKVMHFGTTKEGNLIVLTDDGKLWERVIITDEEGSKFKFREITIDNEDVVKK